VLDPSIFLGSIRELQVSFYQAEKSSGSEDLFSKTNYPQTMRTLKNTDDLVDRTKSACLLQAHQKPNLYAVFSLCCSP
jgi:hypothetical protein